MSSNFLKINEKNIENFMKEVYFIKNPLHSKQYAYQEGKSAIHAIRSAKMKIEKYLKYKNIVAGLAIDIEGAFDNTNHEVIKRALMKRKISPIIINWIVNMLKTRSLYTELNGINLIFQPTQGCPQGGNLSPLLWSLVNDELIVILNNLMYCTEGFADDLLILVRRLELCKNFRLITKCL